MADETTGEVRENARKVREGLVTSSGMDKTAVVTVTTRKPHPRYHKTMARSTRLYVHDEARDPSPRRRQQRRQGSPLHQGARWLPPSVRLDRRHHRGHRQGRHAWRRREEGRRRQVRHRPNQEGTSS